MKLIMLRNYRCGELDTENYWMVPDDWTNGFINESLIRLKKEYMTSLDEMEKSLPPSPPRPNDDIKKVDDNGLTVGELKDQWKKYEESVKQRKALSDLKNIGFSRLLQDNGFVDLYDAAEGSDFNVDWGHNHGMDIKY